MELTSEKLESVKTSISFSMSAIGEVRGVIASINCNLGAVNSKINAASSALSSIAGGISESSSIVDSIISTYNEIEEKLSGASSIESMTLEETESLLRSLDYSLPDFGKVNGYVKELKRETINISKDGKYDIDLTKVYLTKKDAEDSTNNVQKRLKADAFKNVRLQETADKTAYLIIGADDKPIGWTNKDGVKSNTVGEELLPGIGKEKIKSVEFYNMSASNDAAEAAILRGKSRSGSRKTTPTNPSVEEGKITAKKADFDDAFTKVKESVLGKAGDFKDGVMDKVDDLKGNVKEFFGNAKKTTGPVLYSLGAGSVSENGLRNIATISQNDMVSQNGVPNNKPGASSNLSNAINVINDMSSSAQNSSNKTNFANNQKVNRAMYQNKYTKDSLTVEKIRINAINQREEKINQYIESGTYNEEYIQQIVDDKMKVTDNSCNIAADKKQYGVHSARRYNVSQENAEKVFEQNINNLVAGSEKISIQLEKDNIANPGGSQYSMYVRCYSNGKHTWAESSGEATPTHYQGNKMDIRFVKDGVELTSQNATAEDYQYINAVLKDNGYEAQWETTGGTLWADTYPIDGGLNCKGQTVTYGSGWGREGTLYNSQSKTYKSIY